jgi:hypothetical protein
VQRVLVNFFRIDEKQQGSQKVFVCRGHGIKNTGVQELQEFRMSPRMDTNRRETASTADERELTQIKSRSVCRRVQLEFKVRSGESLPPRLVDRAKLSQFSLKPLDRYGPKTLHVSNRMLSEERRLTEISFIRSVPFLCPYRHVDYERTRRIRVFSRNNQNRPSFGS